MESSELEARQVLALLLHKLAYNTATRPELIKMIEGLGFDPLVVARWDDRRLSTGPLKPRPGIVKRGDE
jgi:hypothetical protein